MAQHDYVIANGTGAAVRSDLNAGLAAIVSQNSGATAPSTTYAYQSWADTSAGVMKMRNGANNAWISLYELDGTFLAGDISLSAGAAATPSLFFTGDTNTGIYSPGADQVGISTGGTSRITIDGSGNVNIDSNTLYVDAANNRVGIGTTGPSRRFVISNSGAEGLEIGPGESANINQQLHYNRSSSVYVTNRIDAADHLFWISGSQKASLDTSGRLLVGVSANANGGILQLSGGITFPATAVAATDPNTLDDYEEGTFTPTVIGTSTAGTVTYGTRVARYTKVGRLVFIELRLSWSAGTGTGDLRISGLPFTAAGETLAGLSVAFASILTLTANHVVTSRVFDATTEIQLLSYPAGGGTSVNVAYDAEAQIGLAGCYTV